LAQNRTGDPRATKHVAIVVPVPDDWDSLGVLLGEIIMLYAGGNAVFHVVAIDNESYILPDYSAISRPKG